jgi:O-antigen/teichoic acid export membrane protein
MGLVIATNLIALASTAAVSLLVTHRRPWAKLRLSQFRAHLLFPLATNSGFFFLLSLAVVLDRSALTLLVAKFGSLALAPSMYFLLSVFRVAAWSLISAMSRAVQPYVLMWWAHSDRERVASVTGLSTKITSISAGLFTAAFVPFAEPLTKAWVGPTSFPGTMPLLLFVAAFLIDALFLASGNLLIVMNSHRQVAVMIFVKSLLALALAAIGGLVATDPLVGLTAGVLAATIVGNAAMPLLTCNTIGISMRSYLDRYLIRPLACSLGVTAISFVVAESPSAAAKAALTLGVIAIASAFSWRFVLDSSDRYICKQIGYRVYSSRRAPQPTTA